MNVFRHGRSQFALQILHAHFRQLPVGLKIVAQFDQVRRNDPRAFAAQLLIKGALNRRNQRGQIGARLRIERTPHRKIQRATDALKEATHELLEASGDFSRAFSQRGGFVRWIVAH